LKYLGIALGIASLISVFLTFMWLRSRRKWKTEFAEREL
jgi:hypothetical protein